MLGDCLFPTNPPRQSLVGFSLGSIDLQMNEGELAQLGDGIRQFVDGEGDGMTRVGRQHQGKILIAEFEAPRPFQI